MNRLEELVCTKFKYWYERAFCIEFVRRVLRLRSENCAEYARLACIEQRARGDHVDVECIESCAEERGPYLCGEAVPPWLFNSNAF